MNTSLRRNREQTVNKRMSGLELLRILAACSVIILHYNDGRAFRHVQDGSLNQIILYLLESLCICAVDLFILISGYFLCKNSERSFRKAFDIVLQVILFKVFFYILSVILMNEAFSINEFLFRLLPNNYYVVLYIVLYFISPYINLLFERLSYMQWKKFIFMLLLLFSVWPTCVDLFEEIWGKELVGLSSIGAWGSQQGFNIVNFVLVYCIAGFIRYNDVVKHFKDKRKKIVFYILACTIIIFAWGYINRFMVLDGLRSAWVYHNPFVIAMSFFLFVFYCNLEFSSLIINKLASASFTCFLLHSYFLEYALIGEFVNKPFYIMIAHIFVCLIIIYLCSYIVHLVYWFVIKRILSVFSKSGFWR